MNYLIGSDKSGAARVRFAMARTHIKALHFTPAQIQVLLMRSSFMEKRCLSITTRTQMLLGAQLEIIGILLLQS
jgi:hypothetical protein